MLREEIDQILKEKPRQKDIQKARDIESRIRFFTETYNDIDTSERYVWNFLSTVKKRLNNEDSYNNFLTNLTFPLKVNEFIENIYSKLSNIWQGQNPYIDYYFKSTKDNYHSLINIDYFKDDVWEAFKFDYNSIIVTDIPETGGDPSNLLVSINNVLDVLSKKNEISHLIFEVNKEQLAVIDSEYYQLWDYKDSNLGLEPIIETRHELGKCPAVWLSELDFNTKSNIIKSNPLSKSIGKIEDLQIIYTLKNILSPYAFYQFIVKYKNDSACNYDDGKMYCNGGYLRYKGDETSVYSDLSTKSLMKCPQCNKTPGVGDVIQKPIPLSSDDPNLTNVIEFVSPDTAIMEYGDKYILSLENDIFNNIVGTDEDLNPQENHNETAYKYNTEGQQDVIFRWKALFENLISKVHDNTLKLKYGDSYVGNNINLGTDFILASLDSLYEEKEKLNKLGLSDVFDFNKVIINAKYQSNPDKKRKALIINEFKPFDEGIDTLELSAKDGLIDKKDYIKQKYLNQIIFAFEKDKIPLSAFDKEVPISKIVDQLNMYFETWYKNKFETIKENDTQ